jgi:hypothetical protein
MKHAWVGRPRRATLAATFVAAVAATAGITVNAFAADAALQFDFENGDTAGWSKSGGSWSVVADGGSNALRQSDAGRDLARMFAGDSDWTDYTLQGRVRPVDLSAADAAAGIVARADGARRFVRLVLVSDGARLQEVRGSAVTTLGSAKLASAGWHTLKLSVDDGQVTGYVDNVLVGQVAGIAQTKGRIGVQTVHATASFDDITVGGVGSPTPSASPTPPATSPEPTPSKAVSAPPSASASPSSPPSASPSTSSSAPAPADPWSPPSNLVAPLAKVWEHEEATYSDLYGFRNYGWDQLMAGTGTINYCVRWDSAASVTAAQRDAVEATLQRQYQKWMDQMLDNGQGWNSWPYKNVSVNVVGWAVRDRSQLTWTDNSVDVYVNDINEDAPQCSAPCGRFFHQDGGYSGCAGGKAHHYDHSLWLTAGFGGGAGGDWGQRVGSEYYMNNLNSDNVHILLHEIGHTYGLDDFYDWDPLDGSQGFLMMAGSAAEITTFDKWMLRDFWRHLKSRYGL